MDTREGTFSAPSRARTLPDHSMAGQAQPHLPHQLRSSHTTRSSVNCPDCGAPLGQPCEPDCKCGDCAEGKEVRRWMSLSTLTMRSRERT